MNILTVSLFCQLEKLTSKDSFHYDIICFHYYIQFHLHIQVSKLVSNLFFTYGHLQEKNFLEMLFGNDSYSKLQNMQEGRELC